jgi:prepilin-type N-terminal cleavage/methylation domain-containing protein
LHTASRLHQLCGMSRGFSLVELLIAMAVLCSAGLAIAGLPILSLRTNEAARSTTTAAVLASQRLEQLQSTAWSELRPSPAAALEQNTTGWCDVLDDQGNVLGACGPPPTGAVFVRRWSLEMPSSAAAFVIQVAVTPIAADVAKVGRRRRAGEVRIVGFKRQPV